MGAAPAAALELGELHVESTLGQPLRASIAYALAPNEELAGYCVSLGQAREYQGVPALTQADVSVSGSVLRLTGHAPVTEPLVSLVLRVDCPYSARLAREYTAFVDPAVIEPASPAPVAATQVAPAVASRAPAPVVSQETARRAARAAGPAAESVRVSTRYRVQHGDTLSGIAQRIENRGVSLWDAVEQIHAANPEAFIDNDPNLLKAGAWLAIPEFAPGSRFVAESASAPATAPVTPVVTPAAAAPAANAAAQLPLEVPAAGTSPAAALEEARPGDVVVDGRVVQAPAGEIVLIDNESVATPAATSPNVPVARVAPTRATAPDTSLWWIIGGGFMLLGGLLYFGLRSRFAGAPVRRGPSAAGRDGDASTIAEQVKGARPLGAVVADDYDLDDDSPTSENFVLDADLVIGTGLHAGDEIHVAEDFGFDTSTDLDLEFPPEDADRPGTDIIPPPRVEQGSILENEVLPEDDDYDMSIVMDVTKVPDPIEVTEHDLRAVALDSDDDTRANDAYTVSQEVDYQVLEQDYEDELTATQALNLEIEKAVADLACRLDAEILSETAADPTPRAPLANVTAFNSLSAGNDDDAGDLDITSSLEAGDTTGDTTISEAPTARLPAADATGADDDSIEITIESGKLDTKAAGG